MPKDNPEFEYVPTATLEVRPIKIKEAETGLVYLIKTCSIMIEFQTKLQYRLSLAGFEAIHPFQRQDLTGKYCH